MLGNFGVLSFSQSWKLTGFLTTYISATSFSLALSCISPKRLPRIFLKSLHIILIMYENRVSKHFVIFLNFPCLIACLLCCLLMLLFFWLVLWLGICVEVDVDRITINPPPYLFSVPTILPLRQVTVISLKSAGT